MNQFNNEIKARYCTDEDLDGYSKEFRQWLKANADTSMICPEDISSLLLSKHTKDLRLDKIFHLQVSKCSHANCEKDENKLQRFFDEFLIEFIAFDDQFNQ